MDTAGLFLILIGIYFLDSAMKNRRPLETARRIIADPSGVREAMENPETFGEYSSPGMNEAVGSAAYGAAAGLAQGAAGVIGSAPRGLSGGNPVTDSDDIETSSGAGLKKSSGSYSQRAAIAISFAKDQIGKPYVWGGDGYDNKAGGFDCSGLVHNAWKKAGVSIPRTTATMLPSSKLMKINKKDLLPGDLVFPFPGHVQLYIGNNRIIEAPGRGRKIREKTLGSVWQARRIYMGKNA